MAGISTCMFLEVETQSAKTQALVAVSLTHLLHHYLISDGQTPPISLAVSVREGLRGDPQL